MSAGNKLRVLFQVALLGGGCLGLGYVTMKVVTPSPEETYAALAPDLRRRVDANRAARLARDRADVSRLNHELTNPDPEKPVWADPHR